MNTIDFSLKWKFYKNQSDWENGTGRIINLPHDVMLEENGINYIEVRDFVIRQAASQWAPPTAYQDGMVGPHWSKGWIIDDCEIYEAKCSGISLGKYLQPERDCICQAANEGWSKETVGSHQISNCYIHDCGQTGIVGHMGGVFSVIQNNHIERINIKKNLAGSLLQMLMMLRTRITS